MSFVGIGYGTVAPLHLKKLELHGVKCAGYMDADPKKHSKIEKDQLRVFKTYQEALEAKADFWVVSTPPEEHLPVFELIASHDPCARIIMEKPVCAPFQIPRFKEIMANFKGKITVNENYLSSGTTAKIKETVARLGMIISKITVEMDKNRAKDVKGGRYVDPIGAFAYEGTHMNTILEDIIGDFEPSDISMKQEGLQVEEKVYPRQGIADISFAAKGTEVNLYTSMNGKIKQLYPPYTAHEIPFGDETRYRIASVEGKDLQGRNWTVVGFFEPMIGYGRSLSAVAVFNEDGERVEFTDCIPDDTMGTHLGRGVAYLKGSTDVNPCTVEKAYRVAEKLDLFTNAGKLTSI